MNGGRKVKKDNDIFWRKSFIFSDTLKMVKSYKVEGFDAFKSKVEELAATKDDVYVMFSGSKNADGIRKFYQTTNNF